MQEPILGNVAIDEGVGCNTREPENEKKSQPDAGKRREQKKSEMLAHQFAQESEYILF
jgi:hypothetical protein